MSGAPDAVAVKFGRWIGIAAVVALLELTLHNVYQMIGWVSRSLGENDFRLYYAAAEVGLHHGWSRLYDLDLQRSAVAAAWPDPAARFFPFVSPPPLAWLAAPFTALPSQAAYVVWAPLMFASLVAAALLAAGPMRMSRLIHVLSGTGFLASFVALVYGQPVPLLVLAVISAWRLLLRDREIAAGLVLTLLLLKPQDGLLVLPLVLVSGRWRAAVACAATSAAVVVISIAALGPEGVARYLAVLAPFTSNPYFQRWSIGVLVGDGTAWYVAAAGVTAVSAALAWIARRDAAAVLSVGVLASLVVARYLTLSDLVMLLAPIWLLSAGAPAWQRPAAPVLWLMGWFTVGVAGLMFWVAVLVGFLAVSRQLGSNWRPSRAISFSPSPETPEPAP